MMAGVEAEKRQRARSFVLRHEHALDCVGHAADMITLCESRAGHRPSHDSGRATTTDCGDVPASNMAEVGRRGGW